MKSHPHNRLLGKAGEDLASQYLINKGYRIIQRNFRARYAEIDIICVYKQCVIFVEVKTRADEQFGLPEEAVGPRKLRELVHGARFYMMTHDHLPDVMRIDVIGIVTADGVEIQSIRHIENVTGEGPLI